MTTRKTSTYTTSAKKQTLTDNYTVNKYPVFDTIHTKSQKQKKSL